jgi:hypothetical protein
MMQMQFPEQEETVATLEGTASHEIGETIINAAVTNVKQYTVADFEGKTAENGVVFTAEMYDAARVYADDVIGVMRQTGTFSRVYNEYRVTMPMVHEQSFGTPDTFLHSVATDTVYVWDYKFGHLKVEVFENWQMLNYAPGILEALGINGHTSQQTKIVFRVVQPRAHHPEGVVREWSIMAGDLRAYVNILEANAAKALSGDAEVRTGPHCRHCTGRVGCGPALAAGLGLYELAGMPVPDELSPLAMGLQLSIIARAIKQLEYLKTGYETQIESLAKAGKDTPMWRLEQKYGREKWSATAEDVVNMGDMIGADLRKPVEAITPSQARGLGVDKDVVAAYSEKPKTGLSLVPDTLNKAKKVFS